MNNEIFCPDCNSHDVQEIKDSKLTITNKKAIDGWVIGLLVLFWPIGIFYLLYRLIAYLFTRNKSESVTSISFVCRSCGREFK